MKNPSEGLVAGLRHSKYSPLGQEKEQNPMVNQLPPTPSIFEGELVSQVPQPFVVKPYHCAT